MTRAHIAYHNFCRIHQTLRVTPAMEAGITDHVWNLTELVSQPTRKDLSTHDLFPNLEAPAIQETDSVGL